MADSREAVTKTLGTTGDETDWLILPGEGRHFFRVDILGSSTFADSASVLTVEAKAPGDNDSEAMVMDTLPQTGTERTKTGEVAGSILVRGVFTKGGSDSLDVRITRV